MNKAMMQQENRQSQKHVCFALITLHRLRCLPHFANYRQLWIIEELPSGTNERPCDALQGINGNTKNTWIHHILSRKTFISIKFNTNQSSSKITKQKNQLITMNS